MWPYCQAPASFTSQGKAEVFDERISRYYGLLYFTVCRVLGSRVSPIVRIDCRSRQAGPRRATERWRAPLHPHDANGRHPSELLQKANCEATKRLAAAISNRVSFVLDVSGTKT
jgi:hypothetical protein